MKSLHLSLLIIAMWSVTTLGLFIICACLLINNKHNIWPLLSGALLTAFLFGFIKIFK